ncbi:MAG: phosphoribosylanthranilate isomerase [Myxococcota bacterium]|jgi:phosphoribosylanthranilate isomerase
MKKIITKLCGFTNKETVDLAVECGADLVGFVFYAPSKRNISAQEAGKISVDIPSNVKKVAVFVDLNDEDIAKIIENLKPDFLQIHSNDFSRILDIKNNFKIPIIKAFAIIDEKDLEVVSQYEEIADYFLFDAKTKEIGGSGKSFDWKVLDKLETAKKWLLSGGMDVDNIEKAIIQTGAKMVDLSSGIEETKGIKSKKLIKEFMNKIDSSNF